MKMNTFKYIKKQNARLHRAFILKKYNNPLSNLIQHVHHLADCLAARFH